MFLDTMDPWKDRFMKQMQDVMEDYEDEQLAWLFSSKFAMFFLVYSAKLAQKGNKVDRKKEGRKNYSEIMRKGVAKFGIIIYVKAQCIMILFFK